MKPSLTYIAIKSDAYGNVSVATSLPQPTGELHMPTPGEVYARAFLQFAERSGAQLQHGREHVPALALAADVVSPDGWGHGVPTDLWSAAKRVLDDARGAPSLLEVAP